MSAELRIHLLQLTPGNLNNSLDVLNLQQTKHLTNDTVFIIRLNCDGITDRTFCTRMHQYSALLMNCLNTLTFFTSLLEPI